MTAYIITLDEIEPHDTTLAGGKAANVAELRRAGLRVPAGFVVTTEAYHEFCQANDLEPWIAENRGDRLRSTFLEAPMPAGLG